MQTTSAFLMWEHHEEYENAKRYDPKRWIPRFIGVQYATEEEWRNNSRRNGEAEPNKKQSQVVDMSGGDVKPDPIIA